MKLSTLIAAHMKIAEEDRDSWYDAAHNMLCLAKQICRQNGEDPDEQVFVQPKPPRKMDNWECADLHEQILSARHELSKRDSQIARLETELQEALSKSWW